MLKNRTVRLTKDSREEIKKISRIAKRAATEGTDEYYRFIEKHKKSLKKLADR